MRGSTPLARISSSTLREVAHFGLCQMTTLMRRRSCALASLQSCGRGSSRARRTAHVDTGAVASRDLGIDIAQHHHAAVERDDLAVVGAAAFAVRPDIVPAARATLEPELLHLGLVWGIHHHPAGRTLADHERMTALPPGGGLGAGSVLGPV